MCIILAGKITRAQYDLALKQNGDGYSVYTDEHGLVKAPKKALVDKIIKDNLFAIWHFRIGTSGTINPHDRTNLHPFAVAGGDWYLYHNGVLGDGVGDFSDTNMLGRLLYDATLDTIKSVLAGLSASNKFLLVNAHDVRDYYIFGDWSFDAGVLMSHKMYTYTYTTTKANAPASCTWKPVSRVAGDIFDDWDY